MRVFNRRELLTINAAVMLDKYAFEYDYYDYVDRIGHNEICRTRHINDLINQIEDNGKAVLSIVKQLNEDVEFITFVMKSEGESSDINQLNDAVSILSVLSQLS